MGDKAHIPVLLGEVLGLLSPKRGEVALDCTVGAGGHSRAILERITPGGRLIGIDYDSRALELADVALGGVEGAMYSLFQGPYSRFKKFLGDAGVDSVDMVLFDLGLSSIQLDDPLRGFSFRFDSYLDMRMDTEGTFTAADLINSLPEDELAMVFFRYGEERFARRIARRIVEQRKLRPIETTTDLVDIVMASVPHSKSSSRLHPATRVFQAIRIVVNHELIELEEALNQLYEFLPKGARVAVISFHSLEDRIVKQTFRAWVASGNYMLLTKRPIRPTPEEIELNPRARSAKLRVVMKIG